MATREAAPHTPHQQVRFARSADGVRLAHARHGSGPPLLVVSCWLSHLQYDWHSPVWRHFLEDLGRISTLIRYDERGCGLSDWSITDFSLETRLGDLEAIVADLGYERFNLLGMSGGTPVALAYAADHPDRVNRLIVYGGIARDWGTPTPTDEELAFRAMIKAGWAREDPVFRRVFTNTFIPDAKEEQLAWFDELQRMSTSTENALLSHVARQIVDVRPRLQRITAPTLVLHALDDRHIPFDCGSELAGLIPNARLVPMESSNHILLADEPAWHVFRDEVAGFLAAGGALTDGDATDRVAELSPREREILHLAAEGRSNAEIAEWLVLSVRTVERHLSNAYLKLGIGGKTARTAAVASLIRQDTA